MRIISDFHDYYDCIQGSIYDRDTVYHRKTVSIDAPIERYRWAFFPRHWHTYTNWDFTVNLVGFCGQTYLLFRFTEHLIYHYHKPDKYRYFTTLPEMLEFVKTIPFDHHRSKKSKQFVQEVTDRWDAYQEFIIPHNKYLSETCQAPIWVRDINQFHENPCLRNYGFQHIVDPYTAFQELYMWHCNKANPEKPIPHIDDKTMAEAKGFDKFSFRKEPTKRVRSK